MLWMQKSWQFDGTGYLLPWLWIYLFSLEPYLFDKTGNKNVQSQFLTPLAVFANRIVNIYRVFDSQANYSNQTTIFNILEQRCLIHEYCIVWNLKLSSNQCAYYIEEGNFVLFVSLANNMSDWNGLLGTNSYWNNKINPVHVTYSIVLCLSWDVVF